MGQRSGCGASLVAHRLPTTASSPSRAPPLGLLACPDRSLTRHSPVGTDLCNLRLRRSDDLRRRSPRSRGGRPLHPGDRTTAPANDPGPQSASVPVAIDPAAVPQFGTPIIVSGRAADPMAADETVINEELAIRTAWESGDELIVTPFRIDQFDVAGEGDAPAGGTPTTVTVVGVVRRPSDLSGRLGGSSIYEETSTAVLGPGWWASIDGGAARYGVAAADRHRAGHDDAGRRRRHHCAMARPDDQVETVGRRLRQSRSVIDAIRLQALGLTVVAAVIAVASLVFVGQAVARQVRLEWRDAPTLTALGMSRTEHDPDRGGAIVAVDVVDGVACCDRERRDVAARSDGCGPSRRDRARRLRSIGRCSPSGCPRWPCACCCSPSFRSLRRTDSGQLGRSQRVDGLASLPPTGVAGWAMTRSRRAGDLALGSAVIGVALASAAGIAAWTLTSSYDGLDGVATSLWGVVGRAGGQRRKRRAGSTDAGSIGGDRRLRAVGNHERQHPHGRPRIHLSELRPVPRRGATGGDRRRPSPMADNEIALGRQTLDASASMSASRVDSSRRRRDHTAVRGGGPGGAERWVVGSPGCRRARDGVGVQANSAEGGLRAELCHLARRGRRRNRCTRRRSPTRSRPRPSPRTRHARCRTSGWSLVNRRSWHSRSACSPARRSSTRWSCRFAAAAVRSASSNRSASREAK